MTVSQLDSESWFYREQEVQQITWWIPEEVHEQLVEQSISEAGTRRHMGKLATEAMVANLQDDSKNLRHKTWFRLKHDYEYGQSPHDPTNWNYRVDRHYDDVAQEDKTQLSISVPTDVVIEFTEHIQEKDYGNWLAQCISDEIAKRNQIDRMHSILDRVEGEAKEEDVTDKSNFSNITLEDTDVVEDYIDASKIGNGPENRRGVIAARLRARESASKEEVYDLSEIYGITSRPSKRRDFEEIAKQARVGDGPIEVHPSKKVLEQIEDEYNLALAAELKQNNKTIEYFEKRTEKEDVYPWMREVCERAFYSTESTSKSEQWAELIDVLDSYTTIVCGIPWEASKADLSGVTIDHVRDKADSLQAMVDVAQIATQVCPDVVHDDMDAIYTDIAEELREKPDSFESDWDTEQKKRHKNHTTRKKSDRKSTLTW